MIYKRNADKVLSNLVTSKSGQVLTKLPCSIEVPARFMDVGLGQIGVDTFVLGCFAIILEDNTYAVMNVNSLVELDPYKTETVKRDGVDYYQFSFEAKQVMIKTTSLVKRDTLMFNIFDEFDFKGKIPWYMGYEDLGKLFDTAKDYANSNVANNQEVIELLASMITRHKKDRSKYIRVSISNYKDINIANTEFVPLKSVFYSVNSTVNKLAGSYFADSVTSALVNPTEKVEKIESILRA